MSEKIYFHVVGASRFQRLNCTIYFPDSTPKAIVNIVHSVYEHSKIYEEFMRFLAENGFVAVCHDLAGHGRTARERFELGFFADFNGSNIIVEDIERVLEAAREKTKSKFGNITLPAVIYGHSTGSFAAKISLLQYPNEYDALIISSTAGKDNFEKVKLWFANQMIQLMGERGNSKLLKFFTERKLGPDYEWFSSNTQEMKRFASDPLCNFSLSTSAVFDLLKLKEKANSNQWYSSVDRRIKFLILSGSEDKFGSSGLGSSEVEDKLKKSGCLNVQSVVYEGVRNQILKDNKKIEVFSDIVTFLNENFKKKQQK